MPKVYSKRKGAERPPTDAVYVGRPTEWGNPFAIGIDGTREEVIEKYRDWLCEPDQYMFCVKALHELRGKDLVCWCAPLACHADVLLEMVNQ